MVTVTMKSQLCTSNELGLLPLSLAPADDESTEPVRTKSWAQPRGWLSWKRRCKSLQVNLLIFSLNDI